jgi:DNA-binding NarL/FixJ family response regulator
VNLLLVDDHNMVREGLRAVLERERDLQVVGEAPDGRTALALCATLRPDVVVMDLGMPGLNGAETTRQVTAQFPSTKVVALSMNHDGHAVREMLRAGALAYCVKSSATSELVRAIRAVWRGETFVSPSVSSAVLGGGGFKDPLAKLTPGEREVLRFVAEGYSSKEIAEQLGLAVSTIETRRKQILAKLELKSVAELTKFAIRSGLTSVE